MGCVGSDSGSGLDDLGSDGLGSASDNLASGTVGTSGSAGIFASMSGGSTTRGSGCNSV